MTHYLYCIKLFGIVVYIGVTRNPTKRFHSHRCSKNPIAKVLRERREDAWIEVLVIGERGYIYDLEIRAIVAFETRHPKGFNRRAGGLGCRDDILPSTRARMAAAATGRSLSTEARAKVSAAQKGNTNTRGRHIHSAESRAKISAASKGNTYAKGNTNHLGHSHSPETRARLSATSRGNTNALGHAVSLEARAKMSEAALRRWARQRAALL